MGITELQHTPVTEAPHSMHGLQSTAPQQTSCRVKVSSPMICPPSIATAVARLKTLVRVGHGRLQEWDCVVQRMPRTLMLSLASCPSCCCRELRGRVPDRQDFVHIRTHPHDSRREAADGHGEKQHPSTPFRCYLQQTSVLPSLCVFLCIPFTRRHYCCVVAFTSSRCDTPPGCKSLPRGTSCCTRPAAEHKHTYPVWS